MSDDDLKFMTDDDGDDIDSAGKGHSAHLWLEFDHAWTEALQMNTLVSVATVNQKRDAGGTDDQRIGNVHSDNDFRFLDLKQDWSWQLGDRHLPRWGFNVNRQEGDYDYALVSRIVDPLVTPVPIDIAYGTDMDVRVNKLGVYASWRTRITDALTAEAGARWDSYEYPDRPEVRRREPAAQRGLRVRRRQRIARRVGRRATSRRRSTNCRWKTT